MAKKLWSAREAARHLGMSHRLVNKLGLGDAEFPDPAEVRDGVAHYVMAEVKAWGKARDAERKEAATQAKGDAHARQIETDDIKEAKRRNAEKIAARGKARLDRSREIVRRVREGAKTQVAARVQRRKAEAKGEAK